MTILIDRNSRVLIQGITGAVGSFQTRVMKDYGTHIVAGVTPGKGGTEGVHPDRMFLAGRVGVLSRSGSLSYEVGRLLAANGIGQSTVVGIGGGPLWGLSQQSILKMFQDDPETEAVVLLGEVGGTAEQEAAAYIEKYMTKPVVSLIVGRTAPRGAQMGHAGAIIEGEGESAESKIQALRSAGCLIAQSPSEIPTIIKKGFEIG